MIKTMKKKVIKVNISIKNFSKGSKTEQDEVIYWIRQMCKSLLRHRKNVHKNFTGEL